MKRVLFIVGLLSSISATALGDSATISVGSGSFDDGRYSRPPPPPIVVVDDSHGPSIFEQPRELPKDDPYRSPFRLTVGPAAMTSGQGIGPGLLAAADFGTGTVGVRISAAWFRGETDDAAARLGSTLGLYSGELVLNLHKAGPLHPVFGLGLGAVNIGKDTGGGWAMAGLGRFGLEYALSIDDADVRFGAGVTGALLGPADGAVANARAFAMMNATFSIGF